MNSTTKTPAAAFAALLASLGVTIETSAPSPGVDPAESKESKPWPHIAYTVTLYRNGKRLWSGPYKLGVGFVKYPTRAFFAGGMWRDEAERVAEVKQRNPMASINPETHSKAAAYFANRQNVKPSIQDVVGSLLMDGAAYFDGERFEEWAENYGYSSDSIKAKATFDTCDAIGRDLARTFSKEELAKLRELAAEL